MQRRLSLLVGKEKAGLKATLAQRGALRTVSLFFLLCFAFNFLYFKFAGEQVVARKFTAFLVAAILSAFGISAEADGTLVRTSGVPIEVVGECTGIFSIIVYCSAIFAYPASLREKVVGLIGVPALYALTLVRLVSTALVGVLAPSLLDFFHTYFWQVFLIFFVALLFLVWRDNVVRARP